jgi:hypothetical protein
MVQLKSSWIAVLATETASQVVMSMESLKWGEESKGVNDDGTSVLFFHWIVRSIPSGS